MRAILGLAFLLLACGRSTPPPCTLPSLPDHTRDSLHVENAERLHNLKSKRQDDTTPPAPSLGIESYSVTADSMAGSLVLQVAPTQRRTMVRLGEMSACRTNSGTSNEFRMREFYLDHAVWTTFDECMTHSGFWELSPSYENTGGLLCLDGGTRRFAAVRDGQQHQVIRECDGTEQLAAAVVCLDTILQPLGFEGFRDAELWEQIQAR